MFLRQYVVDENSTGSILDGRQQRYALEGAAKDHNRKKHLLSNDLSTAQ